MATYTSFAVIAAGRIGLPIVEALAAKPVALVVFARPSSPPKALPANVKQVPVDYADRDALVAAFKAHAVEVLICPIGYGGFEIQLGIADAAKAAGVQLFVPSEFGMPTAGHTVGLPAYKNNVALHLESIGLPWARFYVGFFIGGIPWLTGYAENGKINITAKGDVPSTWTAEEDVGGFVAHVLTTLPPARLANASFRLQGEKATLEDLARIFHTEAVYVDMVPGDGLDQKPDAVPGEVPGRKGRYQGFLSNGWLSTGWDVVAGKEGPEPAGSSNHLWEGHHFKTIAEVHNLPPL